MMDTKELNIGDLEADRQRELLNTNNDNKCSSKTTKIGFLKTRKCASSTLQNILIRFAIFNRLNVVIPQNGSHLELGFNGYIYHPDAKFNRSMIAGTPWDLAGMPYDIFCLHCVWDQDEVSATLGGGAVYFTMIRHPVDLFLSAWDYFEFSSFYNNITLQQFAESIATSTGQLKITHHYESHLHHSLLCDFGIPKQKFKDLEFIDAKIKEIDDNFDLILIQERFDESMILLKDLLCWDNTDLLHLKLNRAPNKKSRITEEARKSLSAYLEADIRLYDYFYKKFEQKVQAFGENRLHAETLKLKEEIKYAKDVCGVKEVKYVFSNNTLARDVHK